jgi:hypothetical protein
MAVHRIFLVASQTQESVEAQLHDAANAELLTRWEREWVPDLERAKQQLAAKNVPRAEWPHDLHWDWRKKLAYYKGLLGVETFAILCLERLQGLMMINLTKDARLAEQKGKPLVYVDFLQTAPWNRVDLVGSRQFEGIGTSLLLAAIARSEHEGFHGRIGLHSLPQSEGYYRTKLGMSDLGPDSLKQQLRYFEVSPEQARRLREEI